MSDNDQSLIRLCFIMFSQHQSASSDNIRQHRYTKGKEENLLQS